MIERRLCAAAFILSLLTSGCTENSPPVTPTKPARPTSTPIPTLESKLDITPVPVFIARRIYERWNQLNPRSQQEYHQRWKIVSGMLDPVLESKFFGGPLAETRFPSKNEDLPGKVSYVESYVAPAFDEKQSARWRIRTPSTSKVERLFVEAFFNSSRLLERVIATSCAKIEQTIKTSGVSSLQIPTPLLVQRFGQAVNDLGIFKTKPDWQSAKKTDSDGCVNISTVTIEGQAVDPNIHGGETLTEYSVSTGGGIKVSISTLQPTLANKN